VPGASGTGGPSTQDLAQDFYEATPRFNLESSLARRRAEMARHGAMSLLAEELRGVFPTGEIGAALEVGGEYATTLSVLSSRFRIGRSTSCDLIVPAHRLDGIQYVAAPAETLSRSFPEGAFDLVLLIDVIEHLYDPDRVLDEVRAVLKPSGVLALVTPNLASWLNRLLLVGGYMPLDTEVSTRRIFGRPGPRDGPPAGHIRVFTLRALHEFLRFHGFRVRASGTAPLGFSHATYVAPERGSGSAQGAGPAPVGTPSSGTRDGPMLRSMLAFDRIVARAIPSMGSRIVVVASADGRPRPVASTV
jgi:SAM-dependent methyltransferase